MTMFVHILPEIILHKVSNDISNIDHFVSIQISYGKKTDQYAALLNTWREKLLQALLCITFTIFVLCYELLDLGVA